MNRTLSKSSEYVTFLNDIKARIRSARISASKVVNKALISLYWEIGKSIVEKQARLGWGKARNLWDMLRFYSEYYHDEKLRQLVAEMTATSK